MGVFASAMKATNLVPIARGTISATLKGNGASWYEVLRTSAGSVSAQFGPGAMAGLDVPALISRSNKGEFFPLQEVAEGTINFKSIDAKFAVERGVAAIENLRVQGDRNLIALDGLVPLAGRGLALQGRVEPAAGGETAPTASNAAAFFIGGSWDAPYISPMLLFDMR